MLQKRGVSKGQVTMFVILALVVLIIVGIVIYISSIKTPSIEEEVRREAVPEEFKPVKDYVENCVHLLGIEAIKRLGEHGGYIDPNDAQLSDRTFRVNLGNPTLSEMISLTGEGEHAVPYYLHVPGRSSFRNYFVTTEAPTLGQIELQISRYISNNLPVCVGGFEAVEEKGFLVIPDNNRIDALVKIRDDKVEFFVTYPLNITKGEIKTKMTKYDDIIRFPLKKYYDYAYEITGSELITQYLEGFGRALIQYHAGVDPSQLPPVYARSNKEYIVSWSNAKVTSDIQGLLLSYVPGLQVKDTREYEAINLPPNNNDVEAAFFRYLTLDIFDEPKPEIAVSYYYTGQPIDVRVQPSRGDIIRPNIKTTEGNSFIPQSRDNDYQFFYDLSFPVVVEIRGYEPQTEIPEYTYMFGLEANLIENKRVLEWIFGLGTADWDPSNFEITGDFEVNTPSGETYTPRAYTASLFCDQDTWLSGDVTITTKDMGTDRPLEGVSIVYGCGDYDECWVGTTELSNNGRSAEWVGKLPLCEGGYLALSKYGYGSKTLPLSTREGVNEWLPTQGLFKKKEIDVTVKKIVMEQDHVRDNWEWKSGSISLNPPADIDASNEQIILTLTQKGFEAGTSPISATAVLGKGGTDKETIELIPGEYEVTGMFIDHEGKSIPKECARICKMPVVVCLDYEYYPKDDVVLDEAPWGGVELNDGTTGSFTITKDDLDKSDEIEFYVLELPNPKCIQHLEDMGKIGEYSGTYKDQVWPVFK